MANQLWDVLKMGSILLAVLVPFVLAVHFIVRAMINDLRAELKGEIAALRNEMNEFRTEVRGEIAALRSEVKGDIAALRSEMNEFRAEIRGEMAAFREEVKGEIKTLRTEMRYEIKELHRRIDDLETNQTLHAV